jgi:hypothetical protein
MKVLLGLLDSTGMGTDSEWTVYVHVIEMEASPLVKQLRLGLDSNHVYPFASFRDLMTR